jgi:hypothetical protein
MCAVSPRRPGLLLCDARGGFGFTLAMRLGNGRGPRGLEQEKLRRSLVERQQKCGTDAWVPTPPGAGAAEQQIRPVVIAEAADSGEGGPVIVLWMTAFLMIATATTILIRRRISVVRARRFDQGPAPWADWLDR